MSTGELGIYNGLQESLLEQFIESGGRLDIYQIGRGEGYSTFAIVQCIQQALTTNRRVVYVYDDKGWTPPQFCDLAMWFFGVAVRWDKTRNIITVGDKTIRLIRVDRLGYKLRGHIIDDVFGDVDSSTIEKNDEFFDTLNAVQCRYQLDGTGLRLLIIR